MNALIRALEAKKQNKIEFKPHGLKFTNGHFQAWVMHAYQYKGNWMFNISDEHDNWNVHVNKLDPQAATKVLYHLNNN